jgi:hypothetical protein
MLDFERTYLPAMDAHTDTHIHMRTHMLTHARAAMSQKLIIIPLLLSRQMPTSSLTTR